MPSLEQPIAGEDEAGPVRIARIERVIVPLLEYKSTSDRG